MSYPTPDSHSLASRLTIGVSSFERPEALWRLVRSIRDYYPTVPIIIADDSHGSIYDRDIKVIRDAYDGVRTPRCEYNSGLSVKRNTLVRETATELFCLCDDDFVFTEQTDLRHLVAALDAGLDLAAGTVADTNPYQHQLVRRGTVLFKQFQPAATATTYHGYPLYDLLLNFFVARTAALRAIPWDEALTMREHTDWFLRVRHLKKTLVPACVVEHKRDKPDGYGDHRRAAIAASLEPTMHRLAARGLTHLVGDANKIIDVGGELKRAIDKRRAPTSPVIPLAQRARQVNPVGPTTNAFGQALAVTPDLDRGQLVGPPRRVPPPRPQPATVESLPTAPQFRGLPNATVIPVDTHDATALDDRWEALFCDKRAVVLGSAPHAVLPDWTDVDVIVCAHGGAHYLPPNWTKPIVTVASESFLGLVADTHQGANKPGLAGYGGHHLAAVLIYGGNWTDYHDTLATTYYDRSLVDIGALVAAGAFVDLPPIGLTPTGRDRLLAVGGRLFHAAVPKQSSTWGWSRSGWSTGAIAVALARYHGARSIGLVGISTVRGTHVHEPHIRWHGEGHLSGDLVWLQAVAKRDPGLLWSTDSLLRQSVGIAATDVTLPRVAVQSAAADRGGA